jgi:hypothetical protein
MRRAQASVPPKPKRETMTKLENRLQSVGRICCEAGDGSMDCDMPDAYRPHERMAIERMAELLFICYCRDAPLVLAQTRGMIRRPAPVVTLLLSPLAIMCGRTP